MYIYGMKSKIERDLVGKIAMRLPAAVRQSTC